MITFIAGCFFGAFFGVIGICLIKVNNIKSSPSDEIRNLPMYRNSRGIDKCSF
jgi:hypothetical protein